jgi:helix-turn-helix protein
MERHGTGAPPGRPGGPGQPAGPVGFLGPAGPDEQGILDPAGPDEPPGWPRPGSPVPPTAASPVPPAVASPPAGPDPLTDPAGSPLPLLPGFREMAIRRMSDDRRRLVGELAGQRRVAGLSQTEVAARMGTSQSAVARLEAGEADVRASTLERYAAAIGRQISWRLQSGWHTEEESR